MSSGGSWDVLLIAEINGVKAQYTPKSDASLVFNNFPHLVLDTISNSTQSDRIRMLLQVGCLARLGKVLCRSSAPPFIVSGIYIDDDLLAKWYLVYQPRADNDTVRLTLQRTVTTYVSAG